MPKIINPERLEKLVGFMKECELAIGCCPGASSARIVEYYETELRAGNMDWHQLFHRYLHHNTLWAMGYYHRLPPFARSVFQRYFEGTKALLTEIGNSL